MSRADRFLKACRGEEPDCTPVWFMRQAGRYLPEYRAVRAKVPFLTLCKTPELAAEVTLQPVDILGVDAAILFSDILVVPEAMGMHLVLDDGGPQFPEPLRGPADARRLHVPDPERELRYVLDAVRLARKQLAGKVPLIGFGGAPWTLAAYMIEGRTSRSFERAKAALLGGARALPAGPARRRRRRRADLRLLGGSAGPRRLRPPGRAVHRARGAGAAAREEAARHRLRGGDGRAARPARRDRRGRGGRGLARPARRGAREGGARAGAAGEPRPGLALPARSRPGDAGPARARGGPPRGRGARLQPRARDPALDAGGERQAGRRVGAPRPGRPLSERARAVPHGRPAALTRSPTSAQLCGDHDGPKEMHP